MSKFIEPNSSDVRQDSQTTDQNTPRHILSLSGGKDSSALAIYMLDRVPNMEYVFCDTGEELPETYDYLDKLETYLGKPITRLKNEKGFDEILKSKGGFLPSPRVRWCTEHLKIRPFELFVGDDAAINYVGIRADEDDRKGYISLKRNIVPKYPFIEDRITKEDVFRILEESGVGLPDYYRWRSRSGCYFCFFQQKMEWIGLYENHPNLFARAIAYERDNPITGDFYTWIQREKLSDLIKPERICKVKEEFEKRKQIEQLRRPNTRLVDIFDDDEGMEQACLICYL